MKRRFLCLLLAALLVLSLAACGKPGGTTGDTNGNPSGNSGQKPENNTTAADPANPSGAAEGAKLTGKLNYISLEDRDPSILRGIRFSGNRAGGMEFNNRPAGKEGIRCIFELNEWIAGHPDTDAETGIKVYILQHRDDQKSYETAEFSDEMQGFAGVYVMDQIEGEDWGEFYLNAEEVVPGYYDFVFVYEEKAIAVLLTRFYSMGQLDGKSDEELAALMQEN